MSISGCSLLSVINCWLLVICSFLSIYPCWREFVTRAGLSLTLPPTGASL